MARPRKSRRLPQFPSFRPHRNQFLFSDHYLDELLRLEREWADPPGLSESFTQLKAKYQEVAGRLPGSKEKGTEKDWIQPVLDLLGHHYELDPSLQTEMEGVKAPDYAFFDSKEARDQAAGKKGKPSFWPHILAVGDAKKWDLPLDRKGLGKAIFTNANPNFQIDYYLRATQQRWGLLTNGRLWRLYHVEKSYTLSTYYEVDLVDLLSRQSLDDFKYFYLFFRKEAFVPGVEEKCFLDRAYAGSVEFATALGDSLKKQVYDALLAFAKGALAQPANRLDSGCDLKTIHDNALIFLYRLIFILYAESRDLLPKGNPKYWNGPSLHALKLQVAGQRDKGEAYDNQTTKLWARLRRLFKMINGGDESFGIPPYNGGLFKPDKQDGHPFLEKMRLGDSVVAEIVDLVARRLDKETGALVPVDYRSLGVRQLGSIYEGLLEFKLTVATEPMVAVKEKGKELVVPKPEVGTRKVLQEYKPGDLYAVNDKGERKATGSYFTPEYIVDYIVKHVIGPLLEDKSAKEILAMRFLDPAMGSGHFLVHVVDFVALHLVEQCPDVYDFLKGDEEDEAPVLKRLVVERCVYGVDLNPLAVELAKLSLWLNCVAKDKPLSFLNHHLRCGNSLIGAWLKDLGNLPVKRKAVAGEQGDLFRQYFTQDVCRVLSGFKQIEKLPSDSIRDIHKKEKVWDSIREELKPYERIADLWVSTFFGNDKVDGAVYQDLVANIRHGGGLLPKKRREEVLTLTQGIAQEKRFFHWEIAFPEAFFDKFGRDVEEEERGFDAVIGNPPWVLEGEDVLKRYYQASYETLEGKPDLYRVFMERSLSLTKMKCYHSFVSPNTFLSIPSAQLLRNVILAKCYPSSFVILPPQAFPFVAANIIIYVLKTIPVAEKDTTAIFDWSTTINNEPLHIIDPRLWLSSATKKIDLFLTVESKAVIDKIERLSFPLASEFEYVLGLQVYHNTIHTKEEMEQRVFHASTQVSKSYKTEIGGSNLFRYGCNLEEIEWVNVTERCYLPLPDRFTSGPRIVIREIPISKGLLGGYCDSDCCPNKSTIVVRQKPDTLYALPYLLALVNSSVMGFHFVRSAEKSEQALYPRITLTAARQLPIRRIHFTTPEEERKKHVEVLKNLYGKGDEAGVWAGVEGCLPRGGKGEFLAFKPGATGAEERSDVVHDFLAFLAERMIALHKERQEKAKQFTGWLKEIKGIDTGALKTALKDFWTLDEDGLAQAFKAKKIRASAENWSEIKDELAKYRKAILALNVKIASTDDLIDQIVYLLYGLTNEEVKLVEESVK